MGLEGELHRIRENACEVCSLLMCGRTSKDGGLSTAGKS